MSEFLHLQVEDSHNYEKLHIHQQQTLKMWFFESKLMFLILKMRRNVYSIFKIIRG